MDTLMHPKVEPEIAFLLQRGLGRDATTRDVLAAALGVTACLEMVDSRFGDLVFRGSDNIADDSSAAVFVLGDRPVGLDRMELRQVGAAMSVDGELCAIAAGAAAMRNPASAVALDGPGDEDPKTASG